NYKKDVHAHFGDSAQLLDKLTDSYKEVYQHLVQGARNLCPDYIASQLTQVTSISDVATAENARQRIGKDNKTILSPPLDYAPSESRLAPSLLSPAPEQNTTDKF